MGLRESLWSVTIVLDNKNYQVVLVCSHPTATVSALCKFCMYGERESRHLYKYLHTGHPHLHPQVFLAFAESRDSTTDSVTKQTLVQAKA